jgi:Zn-dependent protease
MFGFPVRVEPFFWLIAVLLGPFRSLQGPGGLTMLVSWVAVFFVSILLHELGHALFMRKYGAWNVDIVLHGMGGYAAPEGRGFRRNEDFIITAAGPAVNFLLAGLAYFLMLTLPKGEGANSALVEFVLPFLWRMNLVWGFFNLLPILPLDGGRLTATALNSSLRAAKVGFVCAIVVAVGYATWAITGGRQPNIFCILMLGYFAHHNWKIMNHADGGWR